MRKLIREMIKESLLLEMFKNLNPYPFSSQPDIIDTDLSGDMPLRFIYVFQTKSGLNYHISIEYMMSDSSEDIEAVYSTFDLKGDAYWEIQFYVKKSSRLGGADYSLTNENDIRVLHTVIEITKSFVKNVLPTLKDEDQKMTREFVSECNSEYSGDARRANVYQYMLKKQGIPSKIAEVTRTRWSISDNSFINKKEYYIKFEV